MCVCVCVCVCVHAQSLSHLSLFPPSQTALSMGFSQKEYWSGLPFLLYGIFLTQGSHSGFLNLLHWQADSLTLSHLGIPNNLSTFSKFPSSSKGKIIYNITCSWTLKIQINVHAKQEQIHRYRKQTHFT